MKRISIIAAVLVVAGVAVAATASSGRATAARSTKATKNIVQTAIAAGQFKTLASLLHKAGLAGTLAGQGPFTVFAPTDAAFAKVPKATLAALAKNKAKLRAVLLYHVVKGKVTAAQAMKLHSVKTPRASRSRSASKAEGDRRRRHRRQGDVMASNGVIHVINKVLIP